MILWLFTKSFLCKMLEHGIHAIPESFLRKNCILCQFTPYKSAKDGVGVSAFNHKRVSMSCSQQQVGTLEANNWAYDRVQWNHQWLQSHILMDTTIRMAPCHCKHSVTRTLHQLRLHLSTQRCLVVTFGEVLHKLFNLRFAQHLRLCRSRRKGLVSAVCSCVNLIAVEFHHFYIQSIQFCTLMSLILILKAKHYLHSLQIYYSIWHAKN